MPLLRADLNQSRVCTGKSSLTSLLHGRRKKKRKHQPLFPAERPNSARPSAPEGQETTAIGNVLDRTAPRRSPTSRKRPLRLSLHPEGFLGGRICHNRCR